MNTHRSIGLAKGNFAITGAIETGDAGLTVRRAFKIRGRKSRKSAGNIGVIDRGEKGRGRRKLDTYFCLQIETYD